MTKLTNVEELDDIILDKSFILDCFDFYMKAIHETVYKYATTFVDFLLCIGVAVYLCSYGSFSIWKFGLIWLGWIIARTFLFGLKKSCLADQQDRHVCAKDTMVRRFFKYYFEYYDDISEEDKELIIRNHIASIVGLVYDKPE